ncbi:transposase [Streptomyces sp. NPDC057136]|uniref:transposase n=1 Tax=Streptomyces sp. NPDC057136 TaxID=3346029 RepID=UPI00363DE6A1
MIASAHGSTGLMPAPRKYPDELRERSVREVQNSGRPVPQVARDLGIHKAALLCGSARPRPAVVAGPTCSLPPSEPNWCNSAKRQPSCGGRMRSSRPPACFSPRSSTSPARGRRGDQPPPRRLRGRARLPGTEPVGLRLQRPTQAPEVHTSAAR